MRRLGLLLLLAALGVAAAPAGAARKTVTIRWSLVGTGPGARSLIVRYEHGGCDGQAHAAATGTRNTIRVRLTRTAVTGGPPRVCAQVIAILTLTVHLHHPVGGRPILGGTPGAPLPVPSGPRAVPRVLGLAPVDARSALRAGGLGWTTTTRRHRVRLPQVVAQSPAAGTLTSRGTVRLVVSGRR